MKRMIRLFCLTVIFCFSSYAQTTYYFSSSGGNDSNDGLTPSTAKQTLSALQTLLNNSKPGNIYLLKRGDIWKNRAGVVTPYSGTVGIDLSRVKGSYENYITIGAFGSGSKPTFDFSGTGAVFQLSGCTYTIIQDLFLTSTNQSIFDRPFCGAHGIGDGDGHDVIFLRVDIDGLGEGYRVQDTNYGITWDGCDTRNTFGGKDIYLTAGNGIFANVEGLTIKNCTFVNNGVNNPADPGHEHSLYLSDCSNLLIENNVFYNSFNAIYPTNGQNIIIRGNVIYNQEEAGIVLAARNYGNYKDLLDNVIVEKNMIYNAGMGIQVKAGEGGLNSSVISNMIIRNNIFHDDNSYGALFIEQCYNINDVLIANNTFSNNQIALRFASNINCNNLSVKNNIFYDNSTGTLLHVDNSGLLSNIDLSNNLYYSFGNIFKVDGVSYTLSIFQSLFSKELNGKTGDPLFQNTQDFKISENSPAIDKGIAISNVTDDFNGNSRPAGAGYDIGAFEYGSLPLNLDNKTKLNIKVLLEGPFSSGNMSTNLLTDGFISLTQPYNEEPWNYAGSESVSSIPQDVVDWVLLELRSGTASSTVVSRKAAFIKSNGSVVDIDGTSPVSFSGTPSGNYYIVVMHRNHLPVMSADPVSLGPEPDLYDFTTSSSKAYGADALADLGGGKWGLYAGDSDENGTINVLDYGNVVNNLFDTGYKLGDLDLNGVINVLDYSKTNNNMFKSTQVPN